MIEGAVEMGRDAQTTRFRSTSAMVIVACAFGIAALSGYWRGGFGFLIGYLAAYGAAIIFVMAIGWLLSRKKAPRGKANTMLTCSIISLLVVTQSLQAALR